MYSPSSSVECEQFMINPHIAIVTIREEPPEEKKGRGIPVVGKNPHTTPMLIIDCNRITVVHPNEP